MIMTIKISSAFPIPLLPFTLLILRVVVDGTIMPEQGQTQRSCPLGQFCRIGTNCSSNVSGCVETCPSDTERMVQGNWSTGNCERIPNGTQYWTDSTLYELLILPNVTGNFKDLLFIVSDEFQRFHDNYDYLDDITFHLYPSDNPYFYFGNGGTTHIAFQDLYDLYLPDLIESCSLSSATSDPIPLDDYELQVAVSAQGTELLRHDIIIHVVDQLPSPLPPPVTTVEFNSSTLSVSESSGSLVVPLVLSGQAQSQSFSVIVIPESNNSLPSSATAGSDFTPGRYTATFTSGATTATASIPIVADDIDEPTERFSLRLYIDGDGYGMGLQKGTITTTVVTIVTIGVTASASVSTSGDKATITLTGDGEFECMLDDGPFMTCESGDMYTGLSDGEHRISVRFTATGSSQAVMLSRPLEFTISGDITVTFSQSTYRIIEDDGPAQSVLVLSNPSSTDITVQVRDNANTAIGGGVDYDSGPFTVTFPVGVTSVSFDIPINNDNILEVDEDFTLTIVRSTLPNGVTRGSIGQTTVTIMNDDDITVRFSKAMYSFNEGTGPAQPALVLSNPSSTDITVQVRDTQNTATRGGVDYDSGLYTVTFTAGMTMASFNVPINDDDIMENDEDFTLTIRSGTLPNRVTRLSPSQSTVTIVDDDTITISFNQSTYSINEDDGSAQPVLVLSNPSSTDITVQVSNENITAFGGGVDYDSGPYTVTFTAGQTIALFSVPINDDNTLENAETFNVTIIHSSLPDRITVVDPHEAAVIIGNDDDITVTFSQSTYSINEDDGPAQPVLVLSNPSSTDITVQVRDNVNTATGGGVDYDSGPFTVTFPVGVTSIPFNIPINNDNILEVDEDFTLTIMHSILPNGVTRGSIGQAAVTIVDDDVLMVQFSQNDFIGSESSGIVPVTLLLRGGTSDSDISVIVIPSDQSPLSAEGNGVDYTSTPITATFTAGTTSTTVDVPVTMDDIAEGSETFDLDVTIPPALSGDVVPAGVTRAVGNITDISIVFICFEQSVQSHPEETSLATVVLNITNPLSFDFAVRVNTVDGTAAGGGIDYDSGPYTATFPAGVTRVSFNVSINDDNIFEHSETLTLIIDVSLLPSRVMAVPMCRLSVTIVDNDSPTIIFSKSKYSIDEDAGPAQPVLILSNPPSTNITVQVGSNDIIATGGVDYDSGPYTVTFTAKQTSASFRIAVVNDDVLETNEDFTLIIVTSSLPDGVTRGNPHRAAVNILNDDSITVTFSQSTYSFTEDDGPAQPVLVLSNPSSTNITVHVRDTQNTATGGGVDYDSGPYTVRFSAGQTTSDSFNIALNADGLQEGNENFNLVIVLASLPANVTRGTTNSQATVTIVDDELTITTVDVIVNGELPYSVKESAGLINIDFKLNTAASQDIIILVTMQDGLATAGSDYGQTGVSSPLNYSVTIPSGQLSVSFSVNIIDDSVQEQNETFILSIDPQHSYFPVTINGDYSFTITIIDDEAELIVQFSQGIFSGTEISGSIVLTIDLLGGIGSNNVTVFVNTSSVTAIAGVDYDATPLTATFKTGETSVTVTIPVVDDRMVNEVDEEFNVNLSISSASGMRVVLGDVSSARGIIIDTTRPQITTHPLNKLVEVNNDSTHVQFTCMAEGASSYFWQRKDGVIPTGSLGIKTNTLILVRLVPPDAGQYRCVAVNQHGRNFTDHAMLTIEADPVATITSSGERANPGDQVTFTCSATGLAANTFVYGWLLNGATVERETRQNLIVTASIKTAGDYQCTAKNVYGEFGRSEVATLSLNQFCSPVTVNYTGFSVTWNETLVGVTVEAPCTGSGLNGTVRRRCKGEVEWEEVVHCFRVQFTELVEETANITTSLNELNEEERIGAVNNIATMLSGLTSSEVIFAEEIGLAVNIVSSLNNVTETVVNMLQPDDAFFEETTEIFDNLLNDSHQQTWQQTSPDTSQALVNSTEQFGRLLGATLNNNTTEAIKTKQNIVVKAQRISYDSVLAGEDYVFPTENDDLGNFTGGSAEIMFSNNVLRDVLDQLPPNTTGFPITNTILRNGILQLPNPTNEGVPKSPILSIRAPVPLNSSRNNSVSLIFDVESNSEQSDASKVQSRTCQFYDHNLLDVQLNQPGGWSQEGVQLDKYNSNGTRVTCITTHLTSFAVLVSVRNEPTSSEYSLRLTSYIGCAISLVCLCLSIILLTYIVIRKRDKINHPFIHLNLCIALALGLVVFLAGIETATEYRTSCIAVAVLLQYFFTSAFCWMLCEGVMLYMLLVTVFGNKLNRRRFFFLLGWGPAIPIVAISAGIAHKHYGNDDYCWITSDDGAILAFIIPIVAIILINCVFLVITLRVLCTSRQNTTGENSDTAKHLLKATIFLLPLLGVTWIIGILAVNDDTVVFAWIFTILNSLQGFFIFVFHILRNKQVIREFVECYNFWRTSPVYSVYSRMRSGRESTSTLGSTLKERTSQSSTSGFISRDKKMSTTSMGSSIAGGDCLNIKEVSEVLLDDDVFAPSLKPIHESITEVAVHSGEDNVKESYKQQEIELESRLYTGADEMESNQNMDSNKKCAGNKAKKPLPLPTSKK